MKKKIKQQLKGETEILIMTRFTKLALYNISHATK